MDVDLGHLSEPCACGREHRIDTERVCIGSGALEELAPVLDDFQNPVLICDSNTRAAAEPILEEVFKDYPVIELDPEGLVSDAEGMDKVMTQLDGCDRGLSSVSVDVLVAIGSGTIHDLTRLAATEYSIPFVSVPTAASMDGYAAPISALRKGGISRSFAAAPPRWIFADTDVFARAPYRLTAAGISEMIGKHISLIDWQAAHMIAGEYYCERTADIMMFALNETVKAAEDIYAHEEDAIEKLMYSLILSGLTMQMLGSSRAASGAEHQCAHLLENGIIKRDKDVLHGECVSVSTLLVLKAYKRLADNIRNGSAETAGDSSKGLEMGLLEKVFTDRELLEDVIAGNMPNPLEDIDLESLRDRFPEIEEAVSKLPDPENVRFRISKAGCKVSPEEIGITKEQAKLMMMAAPYDGNRLTLLRIMKLLQPKEMCLQ